MFCLYILISGQKWSVQGAFCGFLSPNVLRGWLENSGDSSSCRLCHHLSLDTSAQMLSNSHSKKPFHFFLAIRFMDDGLHEHPVKTDIDSFLLPCVHYVTLLSSERTV